MVQIPQWRFRKMRPGEINVDPIEGEFFTTEAIGSITDALVRESIQNSLDAAQGDGPVTIGFSFSAGPGRRSDPQSVIKTYLETLTPHLEARHSGLQQTPSTAENLEHILIEDYGTRGLQGDTRQYDDLDDNVKKNDFYYFWRNIGRTRKEATDIGRWGLGKTVFQAASRINAFFGFTVRKDDSRALLMGQSVLKIHKTGETRYAPYGYFGVFDDELALPVEDPAYLATFASHFLIDRNGKPGLTVLIPYPDKEINAPDCIKSVIKHYFFPILAGRLIVVINHAGKNYNLNAVTLDGLLKKSRFPESQGLLGLLDLARWAIQQPVDTHYTLKEPMVGRAPKLRDNLFEAENLASLREKFASGNRLAFYVPLTIRRQFSKELIHSGFSVFLERDEKLSKAEDHFIRQGITIPEVTSLKHKGVRAIVSITERDLSAFLGDAENPAHTEWERNSKKFKKRYQLGPSTLDFVKSSPREIVKILTQPQKGRDENLLKHLFALQADPAVRNENPEKDVAGPDTGKISPDEFIESRGRNYLQLNAIKGGFSLTKKSKTRRVPRYITIWMAYEVRTGDPFKKYTPLDFDVNLPPLLIQVSGAKILLNKHNVVQIEVQQGSFKLAITGFDINRDLRIKTNP
ncbi:hypothetical protein D1BOALGB6SA_3296 [Olavius sp. associated proteobacterium Delta 1]|nr:hypothetical protein D1BOALGB6SA_3296 [Olavius sp. associated proteobacterium Delta 1]